MLLLTALKGGFRFFRKHTAFTARCSLKITYEKATVLINALQANNSLKTAYCQVKNQFCMRTAYTLLKKWEKLKLFIDNIKK